MFTTHMLHCMTNCRCHPKLFRALYNYVVIIIRLSFTIIVRYGGISFSILQPFIAANRSHATSNVAKQNVWRGTCTSVAMSSYVAVGQMQVVFIVVKACMLCWRCLEALPLTLPLCQWDQPYCSGTSPKRWYRYPWHAFVRETAHIVHSVKVAR